MGEKTQCQSRLRVQILLSPLSPEYLGKTKFGQREGELITEEGGVMEKVFFGSTEGTAVHPSGIQAKRRLDSKDGGVG